MSMTVVVYDVTLDVPVWQDYTAADPILKVQLLLWRVELCHYAIYDFLPLKFF